MNKTASVRSPLRSGRYRSLLAAGIGVLLALALPGVARAQQMSVSGTVTGAEGAPLQGVTVMVIGTDTRAVTGANGRYQVIAPADATLNFSLVGRRPVQTSISGRATVDVTMERVAYLEEVLVTSYTEQRRSDITGAVASVSMETVNRESSASVLQKLAAATPGVTVQNSGSPGSRTTLRIRGISSFQNNDPLYIVDGTPVQDTYVNWLNPNDITSIQVLKDASAASIYGSRASNGVVVIETTKKGLVGPPRTTFRARTGFAQPVRGYDDFVITNSLAYFDVVRAAYQNAGQPVPTNIYGSATNPKVPAYIWPNNCGPGDSAGVCSTVNTSGYAYPSNLIMRGSPGTNWWDAVFGTGKVNDLSLDVSGGSPDNTYGVSFSFFDQVGTAKYNEFKRGTVRVNTEFRRGKLTFGENLAVGAERAFGGLGDDVLIESALLGKNILMQPIVPIRDIGGNWASGKAVGLGNNTNPLKHAYESRNNISRNNRAFGNVFAAVAPLPALRLQSRFGFNVGQGTYRWYSYPTPENAEPTNQTTIGENQREFVDWTLSNTGTYSVTYAQNTLNLLVGQEANSGNDRFLQGQISGLLNTQLNSRYIQDALADPNTKNVFSTGGEYALLSFFGKADYNFADRYVASVTLRRDGSSRLGPEHRWGTFPAFGFNWHATNEPFIPRSRWVNDAIFRVGWGVTGNQFIPAGRIVSTFGGDRGATFYDITGANNSVVTGYRQVAIGNADLKWEENRSINVGTDMTLWDSRLNFVFDWYTRKTENLLFDPRLPATAGVANPPIVNVGSMRNSGFDFSVGHRAANWNVTFNGSHYRNEIVKIADNLESFRGPGGTNPIRFGNPILNMVGHPIGAFYGYKTAGFFRDAADIAASPVQSGAKPGRFKFVDVNRDGRINNDDRTIIGSPHPDFTAGLDLGFRWRQFDLASTIFGTFGNDIFDAQKQYYVFRNFSTTVRKDLLANSWTPTRQNAKYPRVDYTDTYSSQLSDFYVEDGSYVRMRSLQIGYTIGSNTPWISRALTGTRVYLQGDNLFTITGYDGLDPALPVVARTGAAGDVRDQFRGVDVGTYPSNRIFSIGVTTSF
ncbi:MAG TPA: SusC/RagA family TonB-linked outer membrane protein [Gemmatimonadaceae bacterium]|nr:SusC/RagA family TonB-linked outer membrane protein [Gemmatimonadaceae bacterium]